MLQKHLDIFVIVYLDDILIYSKNEKEYEQHIKTVLTLLNKYNLRLKLLKCEFYKIELKFLEYIVRINRVKISKEKI